MSGTSADGIDGVLVEFKGNYLRPTWKILNTVSYEYPDSGNLAFDNTALT